MSPEIFLSIACPACRVASGKRCLLHSGGLRIEPHIDRKLAAMEAVEIKRVPRPKVGEPVAIGATFAPIKPTEKSKAMTLTTDQDKSVRKFKGYSYENPALNFEQVSLKELGRNPFPKTFNGREFRRECLKEFNRERV